jgi:hypothetical protein
LAEDDTKLPLPPLVVDYLVDADFESLNKQGDKEKS